jgi:ATP-dependent protease ClpP protease subunit
MTKRFMPMARHQERPEGTSLEWELAARALETWAPNVVASNAQATENSISIYDPIGFDPWTGEGVTVKRIAGALRSIGDTKDVIVNINSPGGDMFEGVAIYNLLRQHKGEVTTRVLGLAASAASVVAMAGDTIEIARSAFLMMHNTWMVVLGNRNDLVEVAQSLEPFDRSMASIYSARSGKTQAETMALMDKESWFGGEAAIESGFADSLLAADQVTEQARANDRVAAYLLDMALAKAGMPRSERRAMLKEYKETGGTPRAVPEGGTPRAARPTPPLLPTRDAGQELRDAFASLSVDLSMRSIEWTVAEVSP